MPLTREPTQKPKNKNEDTCVDKRESQKLSNTSPTPIIKQLDPWNRLHETSTIARIRGNVYFYNPDIPLDNLDFRITTVYNHHMGHFQDKAQALIHEETINDTHGVIKFEDPHEIICPSLPPILPGAMRQWVSPQKESIHSIQGSITSPHLPTSNGGYSRNSNGGFFSI
ncbi:protein C1orf194-like [Gracilinanus agilis]|uniref:protein C1orf194-like n=1 Tax=Gracilinanus agilis TaxID=191870 RepID=UPI001CFD8C88|nr:protein C1orf194-like [Gracilinanus agilis]